MHFAVFGDVHGNWPALKAVLDDIARRGILTIVHTGDLVVGFPYPNEVVEAVRERGIPGVQGEWDRLTVRASRKGESIQRKIGEDEWEALQWTYSHTQSRSLEFLRALPKTRTFDMDGTPVFVCHGTPASSSDVLLRGEADMRFKRMREVANTPIVVCGKSHEPFARTVDGTLFVNPGAVGLAAGDGAVASYAVVSTESAPASAELCTVSYTRGV
ncbi:MAG: hypothetical protein AMXMBFR84_01990 [Candidatus Hydrogenedentota bacterium]